MTLRAALPRRLDTPGWRPSALRRSKRAGDTGRPSMCAAAQAQLAAQQAALCRAADVSSRGGAAHWPGGYGDSSEPDSRGAAPAGAAAAAAGAQWRNRFLRAAIASEAKAPRSARPAPTSAAARTPGVVWACAIAWGHAREPAPVTVCQRLSAWRMRGWHAPRTSGSMHFERCGSMHSLDCESYATSSHYMLPEWAFLRPQVLANWPSQPAPHMA